MARRTLLVLASHLLTRGYLVVPTDRHDDAGAPTNALLAVTGALVRGLAFKEPSFAVAVIDSALDPASLPPLLRPQVAALPRLLERHGFHVVSSPRAADVVASYSRASLEAGGDVVLIGSDKRLAQLVSDRVWWYDPFKDVRYTPELVRKRFEVGPEHVAGWLALVGDDDVLPGVPGIGKKGATDLVKTRGSIEAALAQAKEIEGRTGKMLNASLELAKAEVERARLATDAPLPQPLEGLGYETPSPATLNALYSELGFYELLGSEPQEDAIEVVVCRTEDDARAALGSLGTAPAALHALTEDPSPARGALAGLAISAGGGRALYFPFTASGPTLEGSALAAWLGDATRPKVGHELNGPVVALCRRGVRVAGVVGDSACASHLAEPSNGSPHDLVTVAKSQLRRALDSDDTVRGIGKARKPWSEVDVDSAAAFAATRADTAAALWQSFAPTVPRDQLDEYLALSETLVRMEVTGIACDGDDLLRVGDDFTRIGSEIEGEIYDLAGKRFNLGSTKQLGSVLFEDLKLPIVMRTKTGWSTATEALERIEAAHPIVALVIRWRELERLKDNWITALRAAIDADGRVHSTFHVARSFSGRLVNSQPDLGRVPGRTPEMARIRRAFRAPPGKVLLSVDYNQLGLYVLAHLSRDPALVDPLQRRDDLHRLTAAAVLDLPLESIGPKERQTGKVVNFATFAGQGASALALQLGVGAQEAKELIERFDRRYARVRAFQDEQLELARTRGYLITLAGRRWPIGGLTALDPQLRSNAERMARRSTHEGSVADVSRRGLLHADRALRAAGLHAQPLLQVHDEVLFEVPSEELVESAEVAATAMRNAFDLVVPLRVGCKAGPSWGALAPLTMPSA